MPTALPASIRHLSAWEFARFLWLVARERHLGRCLERASRRANRYGLDRGETNFCSQPGDGSRVTLRLPL